jgi:hypothetical protein
MTAAELAEDILRDTGLDGLDPDNPAAGKVDADTQRPG